MDTHNEPYCLIDPNYHIVAASQQYAEGHAGVDKHTVKGSVL